LARRLIRAMRTQRRRFASVAQGHQVSAAMASAATTDDMRAACVQQQRVRSKICGLTRAQDVAAVVDAGADAVGLVFYPASKRAVSVAQAAALRAKVPAFVSTVALFANAQRHEVQEVMDAVAPDLLQFHGDESPADCAAFRRRYLKAFRVGAPGLQTPRQIATSCAAYSDAVGWLFDAYHAGYGGSGLRFDLGLLDAVMGLPQRRPIILAGGLTPENVADAINHMRPYAVDVSSGVEDAPGVKSADKVRRFLRALG